MKSIYSKMKSSLYKNKKYFRADILAGITVALALIPEAIAFSFVAWVPPILSLQWAVVMALVAAVFTGRPWMISSSTAAIAIVLAPLIASYWLDYLFATVILMWIIQIVISIFKLWKYTRIIPYPVVLGFLNWLAIVIFLSQWDQFKVDWAWLPAFDFWIMFAFVVFTMLIIHFFPKITKKIPSALVWIWIITLVAFLLEYFDIYHLRNVSDFAQMHITWEMPKFYIPNIELSLEVLKVIFPYAMIAALVWLTEATLTLRVLDEMTNTRWKMNKEYSAQWIWNLFNWFFGWMGWDAMVGQSIINTQSWWRTRLSWIVAWVWLLLFLLFAAPVVNAIPLASLIWLMFMVVISTFKWETFKYKWKIPISDIIIIITVSIATVFTDLATAVIIWVLLSTVIFAREKWKKLEIRDSKNLKWEKIYRVNGLLFFWSSQIFKDFFQPETDPDQIIIDFKYWKILDTSSLEAIDSIVNRYEKLWKKVLITRVWDSKRILKNSHDITKIQFSEVYDPSDKK